MKAVIILFLAQSQKHVILMIGGTKSTCCPIFADMVKKFPLSMRRTYFREAGLNGGLPQYLKGRAEIVFLNSFAIKVCILQTSDPFFSSNI